jgi:hypothetical protein
MFMRILPLFYLGFLFQVSLAQQTKTNDAGRT